MPPSSLSDGARLAVNITVARRINAREETIAQLKEQTLSRAADALREALLQGSDLMAVRKSLSHGQWSGWLDTNCPAISERTAQRYMRLAADPKRVGALLEAGSMRQALALLEDSAAGELEHKEQTKQWPPYMESIGRLSKLLGYVERFPVVSWPTEGLEKFREDLQPLAASLWPEKF